MWRFPGQPDHCHLKELTEVTGYKHGKGEICIFADDITTDSEHAFPESLGLVFFRFPTVNTRVTDSTFSPLTRALNGLGFLPARP